MGLGGSLRSAGGWAPGGRRAGGRATCHLAASQPRLDPRTTSLTEVGSHPGGCCYGNVQIRTWESWISSSSGYTASAEKPSAGVRPAEAAEQNSVSSARRVESSGNRLPGSIRPGVRTAFPRETAPRPRRWGPLARRRPVLWMLHPETLDRGAGWGLGADTRGTPRSPRVLSSLPAAQCCRQAGEAAPFFPAPWKYDQSRRLATVTVG